MKNYIRIFLKYTMIFIIMVVIALGALLITAQIPRAAIEENIKESVPFFKQTDGIEKIQNERDYTYLHIYTDSILLNMIYCLDTTKPLESVMWSKFYETIYADINKDFIEVVEKQKQEEPTKQYLRYWHGSMAIVRPLLTILNIEQIYLVNQILLWTLAITLLIILLWKNKKLAIIYIIAMTMIAFPIVPLCLAYSWAFYIMLISSIIAIFIEKKGDKGLFLMMFLNGILTCYLDFLDTELITMLVPILIVLFIRKQENRLTSFKQGFIFLLKSCILWSAGYVGMWFAKWLLASVILDVNAIKDYVKDNFILRINGLQGRITKEQMYWKAFFLNWHNLYPINILKASADLWKIVIGLILVVIITFDWKNMKKKWFAGLLLIIALAPYLRYLILANHSQRHAFFTFRIQVITIMAVAMIFIECLNYKLLFKEIKLKKKKNKDKLDSTK